MSKLRVYELARQYGMTGPEMAKLLRENGFEKVKSHMAVLDDAEQLLIEGHLMALGLSRKSKGTTTETAGEKTGAPRKKALPGKKPLPAVPKRKPLPPPLAKEPPRKKPLSRSEPAVAAEGAIERAVPPRAEAPTETPAPAESPARAREAEEPAPAAQEVAPTPVQEEPRAAPAEEAEEARPETASPVSPKPESPAEEVAPQPHEAPRAEPAEPAAAASPSERAAATQQPAPAPAEAPRKEPESKPEPPAARPEDGKPIKRLIAPKPKAEVLGRIDLPQETIRDATRRSAPPSERDAADRNLRRRALQSTQSRSAARTPGARRGPGPGGRGGDRTGRRKQKSSGMSITPTIDPDKVVEMEPPFTVKRLSEALGVKVTNLVATLAFKLGVKGKTINSSLTPEEIELVALEIGRKIKLVEPKEAEEELLEEIIEKTSDQEEAPRAPVLTFMGHVDHGKTTLLDKLRESDVARSEAGGITQHIGAYRVTWKDGRQFVVLDTPGHAAFTSMRARGASLTDIVVLVVAADDGVMPQTEEAINHAREAGVPIVVAVNKIDRPNANPMQVRQQLAVKGLQPEEWGGQTQVADISAVTGQGLDDLVEKIFLEAELLDLKARPNAPGQGVVIESKQTPEQGVVVNVLVTDGTLRVRDTVLCGETTARIRGMMDDHGRPLKEAGPATPVTLLGLDKVPMPGDKLYVVADTKKAKQVVEERQRRMRDRSLAERSAVTLDTLSATLKASSIEEIKIILKADVMGSLEPIRRSLEELSTDEVRVNIIHSALGGITEADVSLAEASGAIIIGFNSAPDPAARQLAERSGVEIRFYDVIYELIDEVRDAMEGLLAPEEVERVTGHAEIRAVFRSSRFGNIAGCYVNDGVVTRGGRVRLIRDGNVIWSGRVASLRREKDDVREVRAGFECGLTLDNYNDIKIGDQLEFYDIDLVKRSL